MPSLAELQWLRPLWLAGIPVTLLVVWLAWRDLDRSNPWTKACDLELLPHLLVRTDGGTRCWPFVLLGIGFALASLALAGPAWQRSETPLWQSLASRVLVLDLSRSMYAVDVAPNRITRARFKIADLLERSQGDRTGLVVFAGEAFVVAPLTRDVNTLTHLLWSLNPDIMPVPGSRPDLGLIKAGELLRSIAAQSGQVILVTDGFIGPSTADVAARLQQDQFTVSVLAAGTAAGAPIPLPKGGFLVDANGQTVVPKVPLRALRNIAEIGGGRFAVISATDDDIDHLLSQDTATGWPLSGAEKTVHNTTLYRDEGWRFAVLLLPLAVFAFRRGWLLVVPLALVVSTPAPLSAAEIDNVWLRADQQTAQALQRGDYDLAIEQATDYRWRGAALYRAEQYSAAAQAFAESDDSEAHYNRGNALAKSGQLKQALTAYDHVLETLPEHPDATLNRLLVKKLLAQQQQQQQTSNQTSTNQNQDDGQANDFESKRNPNQSHNDSDQSQPKPQSEQPSAGDKSRNLDGDTSDEEATDNPTSATTDTTDPTQNTTPTPTPILMREDQQRLEQWLRRIPDDPGGLLQRKFALEHRRRGTKNTAVGERW